MTADPVIADIHWHPMAHYEELLRAEREGEFLKALVHGVAGILCQLVESGQ